MNVWGGRICLYFVWVVCRIVRADWFSWCVCIKVCKGVQHPLFVSIGKSPPFLTVCLDTPYLCSDCRPRSWLCAPMYSSCSFSLPPLCCLSFFLSFFLFFPLVSFLCLLLSESHSSQAHKHTHSTQRYTSTGAFMRIFTFKYTHMHYSFSCTQGYIWLTMSQTTCIC